ncbi:hypothetical protein TU78_08535 [Pseudomonas taetrolens]|uniref:Uncharacterized protein n=1 Tax=Pseudomonas taetrolens TaxID=47884 RepID=A0A0J6GL33_PSETA|nr:hypothetical protein TU78_08535 [Pseudomonas taetrolens]
MKGGKNMSLAVVLARVFPRKTQGFFVAGRVLKIHEWAEFQGALQSQSSCLENGKLSIHDVDKRPASVKFKMVIAQAYLRGLLGGIEKSGGER